MKTALLSLLLLITNTISAVEIHTENGDLYKLAEDEYAKGNLYNAKEQFLKVVESEEYKGVASYFLGYIFASSETNFKDNQMAIKYYQVAAKMNDDRPKVRYDALYSLGQLNKGTKAGLDFAFKASKLVPQIKKKFPKYYKECFTGSEERLNDLLIWQCAYQLSQKDTSYKGLADKYFDKAMGGVFSRGAE